MPLHQLGPYGQWCCALRCYMPLFRHITYKNIGIHHQRLSIHRLLAARRALKSAAISSSDIFKADIMDSNAAAAFLSDSSSIFFYLHLPVRNSLLFRHAAWWLQEWMNPGMRANWPETLLRRLWFPWFSRVYIGVHIIRRKAINSTCDSWIGLIR